MRTMLYCNAPESTALPMSPTSTDELPTDFSGIEFIDVRIRETGCWRRCYSPCDPIRTSPAGKIRLESSTDCTTSLRLRLRASSFSGSTYI